MVKSNNHMEETLLISISIKSLNRTKVECYSEESTDSTSDVFSL